MTSFDVIEKQISWGGKSPPQPYVNVSPTNLRPTNSCLAKHTISLIISKNDQTHSITFDATFVDHFAVVVVVASGIVPSESHSPRIMPVSATRRARPIVAFIPLFLEPIIN